MVPSDGRRREKEREREKPNPPIVNALRIEIHVHRLFVALPDVVVRLAERDTFLQYNVWN